MAWKELLFADADLSGASLQNNFIQVNAGTTTTNIALGGPAVTFAAGGDLVVTNDDGTITYSFTASANPSAFAHVKTSGGTASADSSGDVVTFVGENGVTVLAGDALDTVTFGLSSVPNTALSNSSIGVGNVNIALGATATGITGLTDLDLTADNHTIFDGVGSNTLTIGASATDISMPGDVTVGATLTVTGDLVVNGTTTTINTTNLEVTDQWVIINDNGGAANAGFVVHADSATNTAVYGWDSGAKRWAFDHTGATAAGGGSGISFDSFAVAVDTSSVTGVTAGGAGGAATEMTLVGNLFVNTTDEKVWIFV